jgi:hypothetical protein
LKKEQLGIELAPFADIGEVAPKVSEQSGKLSARFVRDSREVRVVCDQATGTIQCTPGKSPTRTFPSIAAMLASDIFANMRKWANTQRDVLRGEVGDPKRLIPINAVTSSGDSLTSVGEVNRLIGAAKRPPDATEVLLIDGPAGIGKTSLISQLALSRAEEYSSNPVPLILHVKSRGRVLSNLDDLMAFSLQTIRSSVTYDQVPILVRHGLVVVAIDGFDELGDPNGYDTAWAQLGELISFVRGAGTLILAGRDTFISRTRLLKDVNALREGIDVVNAATLQLPTPLQAKKWLTGAGWTEADFRVPAVAVLFEVNSFALRPVFLKLLAAGGIKAKQVKGEHERYLTPFLLDSILRRETGLFGKAVKAVMTAEQIHEFLDTFMLEVAREMADMQVEALDTNTIGWIAEAALGGNYPHEIVGLIKNRASVTALLVNDERPGYKAFVHTYLLNYYLSRVAIQTLSRDEIPKFIRRNILGAEFLSTFIDVSAEVRSKDPDILELFFGRAPVLAQTYVHIDRGARNIGALLLAGLQNVRPEDSAHFSGFQVDDSVIRGTAGPVRISSVVINQFDCRQADISAVVFADTTINSLIADDATRLSESFPVPRTLTDGTGDSISNTADIGKWLEVHGRSKKATASTLVPRALRDHPVYALLGRACRLRQYWLRDNDDDIQAAKIVRNENWAMLSTILDNRGFLRVETRNAAGRKSKFFHLRQPERLLLEDASDAEVAVVFKDLVSAIAN